MSKVRRTFRRLMPPTVSIPRQVPQEAEEEHLAITSVIHSACSHSEVTEPLRLNYSHNVDFAALNRCNKT